MKTLHTANKNEVFIVSKLHGFSLTSKQKGLNKCGKQNSI